MKNLLKSLLAAATLAFGSCSNIEFKKGFNAVYAGVNTKQEEGYSRVFTGGSIGNQNARLTHKGLNELSGTDTSTYFGRNSFGFEPLNRGIEAIVDGKMGNEGLFDGEPQYGLRDSHVPNFLGADYGFLQATTKTDLSELNLTFLYRKSIGAFSGEIFNSHDFKNGAKDTNLTELLAQYNVNNNFGLFVRQDIIDLDFKDANWVFGGVINF